MIAAMARPANTTSPAARASGGSQSHSPSQETARNSPTIAARRASAGHSRSQKILKRARRMAAPSCDRAAGSALRGVAIGWFDEGSVTNFSAANSA